MTIMVAELEVPHGASLAALEPALPTLFGHGLRRCFYSRPCEA